MTIELTEALKGLKIDLARVTRPSGPTAAASASPGNLNGSYHYGVSFVTDDGETEVSGATSALAVASKQVDLTNIAVSSDSRVTARKIYRTPAGAADQVLLQLVATIADNATTTYTDNLADGGLGAAAPYVNTTGRLITDGADILGVISELSISIGSDALSAGGYASTAVGTHALEYNVSGYRNTAFGYDALRHNTTGSANTGVGVHAGDNTTTGSRNVSVGYASLQANTTGSDNVVAGASAATSATALAGSVVLGAAAMQQKVSGGNNVAIGYQAHRANGTGTGNVAVGYQSGTAITDANFITLIGHQAGKSVTTGTGNVAVGMDALGACTTGQHNVAIGRDAGDGITTGSSNIVVGYNLEPDSPTGSNQINIGSRYYHDRIQLGERASDPSDPTEGNFVFWMSDGTGVGDDGDIMIKITAGGVTKTATLVDFSAS